MPPHPNTKRAALAKLILGSKSWSRRTLLSELDFDLPPFDIVVPDIDEAALRTESATDLVLIIAIAKARALLSRGVITPAPIEQGKTLLVCGDSVVKHKGRILEKPADEAEARQFLQSYATAPATTVSSIVVVDVHTKKKWEGVDEAEVYFRPMPHNVIDELIRTGGSMQSAGALRIEHPLAVQYTDCIIGHRSAVMGFSQPLAKQLLEKALEGVDGHDL